MKELMQAFRFATIENSADFDKEFKDSAFISDLGSDPDQSVYRFDLVR